MTKPKDSGGRELNCHKEAMARMNCEPAIYLKNPGWLLGFSLAQLDIVWCPSLRKETQKNGTGLGETMRSVLDIWFEMSLHTKVAGAVEKSDLEVYIWKMIAKTTIHASLLCQY